MIECDEINPVPILYIDTLKALSVVGPPCNILAMYCIVTSPDRFNITYRLNMFILQLLQMVFNIFFSLVAIPVLFFPMTMGYSAGLAAFTPDMLCLLTIIIYEFINLIFVTFIGIHLSRIQMILPQSHKLKISTKGHILTMSAVYTLFCGSLAITGALCYNNMRNKKALFETQFTCAEALMKHVVVAFDTSSVMRLVLNPTVQAIVSVPLLFILTIASMSCTQQTRHLSPSTELLQKRVTALVYLQLIALLVFFIIPVTIVLFVFVFSIVNTQVLGNLCLVSVGFYGIVSAVIMVVSM